MKHFVYILISTASQDFYIGETDDMERRLEWHNSHFFKKSFTSKRSDWEIFHLIECIDRTQARKIENHIKKMKSRIYLRNLKLYPEISTRLIQKYT